MPKMQLSIGGFPPIMTHTACVIMGFIIASVWTLDNSSQIRFNRFSKGAVYFEIYRKGFVDSIWKNNQKLGLLVDQKCIIPNIFFKVKNSNPLVLRMASSDVKKFANAWVRYQNIRLSLRTMPYCKQNQRVVYR